MRFHCNTVEQNVCFVFFDRLILNVTKKNISEIKNTYDQTECSPQTVNELIISSDDDESDFEPAKKKKMFFQKFRRPKLK